MTLAMARPWKHPDTGIYWIRRRLPADLRQLVGKREEKQSLGTRDPNEAKRLHAQALVALETKWSNLRQGPQPFSRRDAEELATRVCQEYADDLIDNSSEQLCWGRIGLGLWESPSRFPVSFPDFDAPDRERLRNWCIGLAAKALVDHGLLIDDAGNTLLARSIARTMHHASMTLSGSVFFESSNSVVERVTGRHNAVRPVALTNGSTAGRQFEQLLNGWASEKRPAAKTLYAWRRVFLQLTNFVGHSDASRLGPDDLIRWKESLVAAGLRGKTIRDGKLAPVRAILQWAADNRKLAHNPAERIRIDSSAAPSERKRSFKDEEARIVLRAALLESGALRRWVPWVSAYTGARVSEVCQLRAEDILQQEGIWCIHFAPEAGSLKNAGSERTIPIHPALTDSGFLKFVKRVGSGPLFSDVTPDRFGSRGGNGTKVLGRWVRALGIQDPRISPNHSWRHRMKTLGRKHGLALDIVDAITGHSGRTEGDEYGEFPLDAMLREVLKIPELKLG